MYLTFILLGIYALAVMYIGWRDHETEDADGFIIADRKVGVIGTFSSIVTSLRSGGAFAAWLGLSYIMGYSIYIMILGIMIAMFIFSFLAPRARIIAKKNNYITISQMIRDSIGIKTEKASVILIILYAVLMLALEFYIIGNLLNISFGVNPIYTLLFAIFTVSFYVSAGGYKSIIKTDILQFFIMLSFFTIPFFIPLNMEKVLDFSVVYKDNSLLDAIPTVLFFIVVIFSFADFWQRIFSARDDKTVKRGFRISSVAILVITIPITMLGFSAREVLPEGTDYNNILYLVINSPEYSKFAISFVILAVSSMIMSTIDSYTYLISSTTLENIFNVSIVKAKKKYIYLSKIIIVSMLVLSAILSLFIENMIDYIFGATSFMAVLAPLFLVTGIGLVKNKSEKLDLYFMCSLIISLFIGVYMFIGGYLTNFIMMLIPVFICSLLLSIGCWLAKLGKIK